MYQSYLNQDSVCKFLDQKKVPRVEVIGGFPIRHRRFFTWWETGSLLVDNLRMCL